MTNGDTECPLGSLGDVQYILLLRQVSRVGTPRGHFSLGLTKDPSWLMAAQPGEKLNEVDAES